MYQRKVLFVDDVWVSVGPTNFDERSFRPNEEANLNIYDASLAAEQVKMIAQDKDKSRRMRRAELTDRSAVEKLSGSFAVMRRRQL